MIGASCMIGDIEIEATVVHGTFEAIRMLIENAFERLGSISTLGRSFVAGAPDYASLL